MSSKEEAKMGDILATEANLLGMIKEYLRFEEFEATIQSFDKECKCKGKLVSKPQGSSVRDSKTRAILKDLLSCFDDGDHKVFFELWMENIPIDVNNTDVAAQSLEFYLHIHFTIYPLRRHPNRQDRAEFAERIFHFKKYLETRGPALSQNTEFLPYYALPFVSEPRDHPSFKHLFKDSWMPKLKNKLEQFLSVALKSSNSPRLLNLYREGGRNTKEAMQQLQLQLAESERRIASFVRKFNKMKEDYHKLFDITVELVDSLEAAIVSGKMITPEYLQNVYANLSNSQMGQSGLPNTDLTRPGTGYYSMSPYDDGYASSMLRAPIATQRAKEVPMLPSLDYEKLKKSLMEGSDQLRALLLQALRWRLTRSLPGEQRDTVLQAYISNDLLERYSTKPKTVLHLLRSKNEIVRQYMVRLISAFASLPDGRIYLSQIRILLKLLTEGLRKEERDSLTRDHVLTTLQKLSLRRNQQTAMIEDNVIGLLMDDLRDSDSLRDYTLEYSTALLMNLCLRTKGRRKCAENAKYVLKVLTDLLGHDNHEIRPYVHSALYSILCVPSVRQEAKEMSVEEILRCYSKEENPNLKRQIEFVIKQLDSDAVEEEEPESDDEEEDDDSHEDLTEPEIEEVLQPQANELSGESLLTTEFLGTLTNMVRAKRKSTPQQASADEPLQRPVTPSSHRGTNAADHRARSHGGEGTWEREDPLAKQKSEGGSLPASRYNSQPPTRSGNRPSTAESLRHGISSECGRLSQESQLEGTHEGRPRKGGPQEEHNGHSASTEHNIAFTSRPKIPRTPDQTSTPSSAHRSRGPALAPQFSNLEPQQSCQPGSASSTDGGELPSGSSQAQRR